MSASRNTRWGAIAFVAAIAACSDGGRNSLSPRSQETAVQVPVENTMGSGSTSTKLGQATFSDPNDQNFDIKRMTGDWQIQIKAKPAFDIVTQSIVFQPGGQSGWHSHPGPVFIEVVSGTMTFYESDDPTCTPIVKTAGQGYLDKGEHPHIARNESGAPSTNLVTYFTPPGATTFKIDLPVAPGNCPF